MTIFKKLFSKKKSLRAYCDISKEPIEKGYGYMLTTAQVVSSRPFWDNIMTEPETMSYTISHFREKDPAARQMRQMIFEKYSQVGKPWLISDSYIQLFEVDKNRARQEADLWWKNNGDHTLEDAGKAADIMEITAYKAMQNYAIMEAGRARVV